MGGEQSDTYNESGSPLIVEAETITTEKSTIQESMIVEDDDDIRFGTDEDFVIEYDSTNDRWRLFDNSNSQDLLFGNKNGPIEVPSATDLLLGANLDVQGDITQAGSNSSLVHDRQDVSSDVSSDGSGYYSVDSSGAARTFTIASADAVDGREINIKRNGSNGVDINTEGTETIDDTSATPQFTLSSDNESVTLVYNSSNTDWEIY